MRIWLPVCPRECAGGDPRRAMFVMLGLAVALWTIQHRVEVRGSHQYKKKMSSPNVAKPEEELLVNTIQEEADVEKKRLQQPSSPEVEELVLLSREEATTLVTEDIGQPPTFPVPPECLPFVNSAFDIREVGRFVQNNEPPSYDHLDCFIFKPRYNCAVPKSSESAKEVGEATNYKLILQHETVSSPCDIQQFVKEAGGPIGVSNYLRLQQDEGTPPIHVGLYGTSFLRQVFQALGCKWRSQVTSAILQIGGPSAHVDPKMRTTGGVRKFQLDETGTFLNINPQEDRCYQDIEKDNLQRFFGPNVTVPSKNTPRCNDDFASIEFGDGSIKFHYFYRPYRWNATVFRPTLHKLGLTYSDVSWGIHDGGAATLLSKLKKYGVKDSSILKFDVLKPLKRLQELQIGRALTADNPWITKPPDDHPCLPGIPDDEVNLLLFLLMTNSTVQNKPGFDWNSVGKAARSDST